MSRRRSFVLGICIVGALGPGFFGDAVYGSEVELGQVVVTATRTDVEISDAPQSISVITKEEIRNTPDRTIPEIIQRAAGVQVNQNGPMGSISTAQIRGSEAGQVLVHRSMAAGSTMPKTASLTSAACL